MTIDVADEDIAGGYPCDATDCPVARAIRRTFGVDYCNVGTTSMVVSPCGAPGELRMNTPQWIVEKIRVFDTLYTMDPFSFEFVED